MYFECLSVRVGICKVINHRKKTPQHFNKTSCSRVSGTENMSISLLSWNIISHSEDKVLVISCSNV